MSDPSVKLFYLQIEEESIITDTYGAGVRAGEDRLEFSDIPVDVVVQKQANYVEEVIPGRSEPWVNYSHSQATVITFTGRLIAMGGETKFDPNKSEMPNVDTISAGLGYGLGLGARFYSSTAPFLGVTGNAASLAVNQFRQSPDIIGTIYAEVHQKVAWLEALTHPQYDNQGRAFPPPIVWLRLGENFYRRGIIKNVNFSFHGPWEPNTLMSYYVDCNITFQELNITPKGYVDVRLRSLARPEIQKDSVWKNIGREALSMARSAFGI